MDSDNPVEVWVNVYDLLPVRFMCCLQERKSKHSCARSLGSFPIYYGNLAGQFCIRELSLVTVNTLSEHMDSSDLVVYIGQHQR